MDSAPKVNSTVASLIVAALAAAGVAFAVEHLRTAQEPLRAETGIIPTANAQRPPQPAAGKAGTWLASAPGRVEPRNGEVRIGSQLPGKVTDVLVHMNDNVKSGDLLVRLSDAEGQARLAGATAEAQVRRRERDTEPAVKLAAERRAAEDDLFAAERAAFKARMDLDRMQLGGRSGYTASDKDVEAAKTALAEANQKLTQARANHARVLALPGVPLPSRLEASLAVARAELAAIETAIEKTRIRAPSDGTVLLVNTRVGETVTPSPEDVLMTFGDLSALQIRAEIEERDVAKVRVGQGVVVRSDAFPGQDFTGTVQRKASALGAPRIAAKGPRRANDQDVMQVVIALDGHPPLVSGLRVDVFFKPDETVGAQTRSQTKAN